VPQYKISIVYWPEKEALNTIAIPYIQFTIPIANSIENNYVIVGNGMGNFDENEAVSEQNYKSA
jgi:hypothetical protein